MKQRKLILILAIVLSVAVAAGGTMAYLQDTDEDVNVMTLGNVYITQNEQERNEAGELVPFTQEKPMYPAVYEGSEIVYADQEDWPVPGDKAWQMLEDNENVIDKIVTVTNTGKSPAYVRTLIAFEGIGQYGPNPADKEPVMKYWWCGSEVGDQIAAALEGEINVDGVDYTVVSFTYLNELAPGETTIPSLKQLYLSKDAGNEEMEYYGEYYDVLVLSQAVQTQGFVDGEEDMNESAANEALDTAFGKANVTKNLIEWFSGIGDNVGSPGDKWPNNNPPVFPQGTWYDEGNVDTDWYNNTDTEFVLTTAEELAGFSKLVYDGNNFSGKTVKLGADVDLGDHVWMPIGRMINTSGTAENSTFKGNFDGQNYTVKNLFIDTVDNVIDTNRGAGFFGAITGDIENLNIETVFIQTAHWAGAVAGSIEGSIKNCHVSDVQIVCLPEDVGDEWDNGDKAGAIVGYATNGSIENCTVKNADIMAYRDLGGIVGASYNSVINCSMENVTLTQDNANNYKNYTAQESTYVNDIIGRKYGTAEAENCTGTATISYKNW